MRSDVRKTENLLPSVRPSRTTRGTGSMEEEKGRTNLWFSAKNETGVSSQKRSGDHRRQIGRTGRQPDASFLPSTEETDEGEVRTT